MLPDRSKCNVVSSLPPSLLFPVLSPFINLWKSSLSSHCGHSEAVVPPFWVISDSCILEYCFPPQNQDTFSSSRRTPPGPYESGVDSCQLLAGFSSYPSTFLESLRFSIVFPHQPSSIDTVISRNRSSVATVPNARSHQRRRLASRLKVATCHKDRLENPGHSMSQWFSCHLSSTVSIPRLIRVLLFALTMPSRRSRGSTTRS